VEGKEENSSAFAIFNDKRSAGMSMSKDCKANNSGHNTG
jgi:hypothetical protein